MILSNEVRTTGDIEIIIDHLDKESERLAFPNTVLILGRTSLAQVLANEIGANFQLYINRMIFGVNGTAGGVPKYVDASRTGLFGLTSLSKPVISSVDPTVPTTAVFTSVISYNDAVGLALSEMAIQMANGNLYSMKTFADLNKTNTMALTINWRLNFC